MTKNTTESARAWGFLPRSGKARLLLGLGTVMAVGGLATVAAVNDVANVNITSESDRGVGSSDRFDIALVAQDGTVEQADGAAGFDWEIPEAATMIPGSTISTEIPFFSNVPRLRSAVDIEVLASGGTGEVAGVPNITPFLRFSAEVDGTAIFTDAEWGTAKGALGILESRGSAALAQGAVYAAGAPGSEKTVKLTVHYLDDPATAALNGGQAAIKLRVNAESTK